MKLQGSYQRRPETDRAGIFKELVVCIDDLVYR